MGWRCAILGTASVLHNIQEFLCFSAWQNIGMARPGIYQATFVFTVIMLTVTVAAVLAVAVRERMKGVWGRLEGNRSMPRLVPAARSVSETPKIVSHASVIRGSP